MKAKPKTRAELLLRIEELEAQLAHRCQLAHYSLPKAGTAHLIGSGVILRLHALGGREITPAILIRDGLSDAAIAALQADIVRSYQGATQYKPPGA